MNFDNNKPIYLQISENVCEKILSGTWKENGRIPSVRELAVELEVNPNTVMRSYEYLQSNGIIYNKRGIGFFVTETARRIIENLQQDLFFKEELPELFKKMNLLGISMETLQEKYKQFNVSNLGCDLKSRPDETIK